MAEAPAGRARRSVDVAALVVLVAGAVYLAHALFVGRVVDDCFITFRYVRNWAGGAGPVFNPGEVCEGYTNFLWLALLTVVRLVVPGADLVQVAQGISLIFGFLVVLGVTRHAFSRRPEAGALRALAPLLVAFNASFVAWSTSGLETICFTWLVFAAALAELKSAQDGASVRGTWQAPLLLALATMARPDGIVFLGPLVLFRLQAFAFGPVASDASSNRWRRVLLGVGVFALVYGPYWIWRRSYYGWPLPNTFYAKVGGGLAQWKRGADYVLDWLLPSGLLLVLPAALCVVRRWREAWVRLFALNLLAGTGYVVSVGGESLGIFRFMVPLVPFLALLSLDGLLEVVAVLRGRLGRIGRAAAATAFGLLAAGALGLSAQRTLGPALWPARYHVTLGNLEFPDPQGRHSYDWFDNYFVDRLAIAGRWLDAHAPADALVASSPAGSIAYHMRQPLLDMLGLNDVAIAHMDVPGMGRGRAGHEKGDGRYVLSRKPRFILLGNVAIADHPIEDAEFPARTQKLKSERELWSDPEFHRDYEKKVVELGEPELADIAPENRHLFRWFTYFERRPESSR